MNVPQTERVRLDKWLWAARFFKTRSLSAEAISGGKVHLNDQRVKPARAVNIGDRLTVRRGYDEYVVIVRGLADRRGPAKVAQTLYKETPESIKAREEATALRKYQQSGMTPGDQRPSGRDRRRIRHFTGKS